MKPAKRAFLLITGEQEKYPNKDNALLQVVTEDPANKRPSSRFISSPIFSFKEEGNNIPNIADTLIRISFFIVPKLYPVINDLNVIIGQPDCFWFSLGLANLIIIEKQEQEISAKVLKHLQETENFTGYETWDLKLGELNSSEVHFAFNAGFKYEPACNLKLPNSLPLYLEFCISEYILSVDKLLESSKRYSPFYFEKYYKTIIASNLIVNDLCFLSGLKEYSPSSSLLAALNATDPEDAYLKTLDPKYRRQKEELLNIKHSMLVQFNSSISYLYSQAYSGTLPLLENNCLINRYSFLGAAGGVSALFELIIQLEKAFFHVPFENLQATPYFSQSQIESSWFTLFSEASTFDAEKWQENTLCKYITDEQKPQNPSKIVENFYHRISFFSGRLGFKEHEFAATAALQVLAQGNSLKWNVINYTHEIIHNHVRIVLNQLLLPVESLTTDTYENWLGRYRDLFKAILLEPNSINTITYKDYFTLVLINFSIISDYYGSLNRPSNFDAITDLRTSQRASPIQLLTRSELKEIAQHTYRDITEIFVHVLDFIYVYKKKQTSYLLSIWLSWSTLPSVTINLRQYILRSLIVICIDETGNQKQRFDKGLVKFRNILNIIREKLQDELIVESILKILSDENEKKDLLYRFYNCILVGDLVANFFVGDIDELLDNNDENRLLLDAEDDEGNPISYAVETGSFKGKEIKSKVRFLLDQLEREVGRIGQKTDNETQERYSAWLLLSLSTINN